MPECCHLITCRLTDQFGNQINPDTPNAIVYFEPVNIYNNHWSVGVEGYIAVYSGEERVSPPIPFCINTYFCLNVPKGSSISFVLESFNAWAATCQKECAPKIGQIKLQISIETLISSQKSTCLLVPQVDSDLNIIDRVWIHADQVFDSIVACSNCCIYYKNAELQAEISQYNTIADGIKQTFQNEDEIKKYGGQGILSPDEVSYINVFVNGLLQPKKNYIIKKGEITFTTQDIPSKGQSIIILFTTWKNKDNQILKADEWQYSTISDGYKKIYVNEDELPEYKSRGIPSADEVSYFNLYINGVLQPKSNYCIRKGTLALTTNGAPSKGAFVVLESISIHDSKGRLFQAETSSYNAYSNGGKIYTNHGEICQYGMHGILDPNDTSYQNLFVNGILQPHVNYIVQRGCLILKTESGPAEKAPITLQSVSSRPAVPCCKAKFSDAALAHLQNERIDSAFSTPILPPSAEPLPR